MSDTIRTLNLYNDIIGIQMTKLRTKKKNLSYNKNTS